MKTAFQKLYKLAEGISSNDELYMPQPFGDDPEHKSTMDPVDPEPLGITQPKEDGNQFTGSKKTADRSNTDESGSPGSVGAPKHVYDIDVEAPPEQQLFGDAGETSRGDGSIKMTSSTINPEARKIVHAYIMENGAPKCSVCDNYYTPKSIADAKLAHCGHCPEDRMDEAMGRTPPGEVHGTWNTPAQARRGNEIVAWGPDDGNPELNRIEEGDVVDGDVVKTAKAPKCELGHRMAETDQHTEENPSYYCKRCAKYSGDDYEKLEKVQKKSSRFTKISNDSELYTRGFLDHLHGKPLDEDLAVLSDDYFHGYDQARYYGKTPLESVGAEPHKVTKPAAPDNSLEGWEPIDRVDHKYEIDRSQIIASTLPTNVLEAFFDTEE